MLKIRPVVCFCSDSVEVFILGVAIHFTIFIQGLLILLFSIINIS